MSDRDIAAARGADVPMAAVIAVLVICALIGGYVLQGRLQNTGAAELPFQSEVSPVVRKLFPQGWAFFTKPADSEALVPFRVDGESAVSLSVGEYAEPSNGFGFDRSKRRQGVESAMLLHSIGKSSWRRCDGASVAACAAEAPAASRRQNTLPDPTLCGPIVLAAEQVTPWSWRHLRTEPRYVAEVVRLEVTC